MVLKSAGILLWCNLGYTVWKVYIYVGKSHETFSYYIQENLPTLLVITSVLIFQAVQQRVSSPRIILVSNRLFWQVWVGWNRCVPSPASPSWWTTSSSWPSSLPASHLSWRCVLENKKNTCIAAVTTLALVKKSCGQFSSRAGDRWAVPLVMLLVHSEVVECIMITVLSYSAAMFTSLQLTKHLNSCDRIMPHMIRWTTLWAVHQLFWSGLKPQAHRFLVREACHCTAEI